MGICEHGRVYVSRGAGLGDRGHRGGRRQAQWRSEVRITKWRPRGNQLAFCGAGPTEPKSLTIPQGTGLTEHQTDAELVHYALALMELEI